MKRNIIIVLIGTLFFVFGGALAGFCGEAENGSSPLTYSAFVDNYIQKCNGKADFLDSGSLNIRVSAMRATLKGAFMQSNRIAMIDYLMEKDVPMNADRIEYHLTRKYTESVHPQEAYALLIKEKAGH